MMPSDPSLDSLTARVIAAGPTLSSAIVAAVLEAGSASVPGLVAVLCDADLRRPEARGGGFAPVHAARLLCELGHPDAIAPLARVLGELPIDSVLANEIVLGTPRFGELAEEPLLAALEGAKDAEGLLALLGGRGVRDERFFRRIIADFKNDPPDRAHTLVEYGDPRAVPLLRDAAASCEPASRVGGLFAGSLASLCEAASIAEDVDAPRDEGATLQLVERWITDAAHEPRLERGAGGHWLVVRRGETELLLRHVPHRGPLGAERVVVIPEDPVDFAVHPEGHAVFVVTARELARVDVASSSRVAIPRPPGDDADRPDLALSSCGRWLWYADNLDSETGRLQLYDAATLSVVDEWQKEPPWRERTLSVDATRDLLVIVDNAGDSNIGVSFFGVEDRLIAPRGEELDNDGEATSFVGFHSTRDRLFTCDWDGQLRGWQWPSLEPAAHAYVEVADFFAADAASLHGEELLVAIVEHRSGWTVPCWSEVTRLASDDLRLVARARLPRALPRDAELLHACGPVFVARRLGATAEDVAHLFVCRLLY